MRVQAFVRGVGEAKVHCAESRVYNRLMGDVTPSPVGPQHGTPPLRPGRYNGQQDCGQPRALEYNFGWSDSTKGNRMSACASCESGARSDLEGTRALAGHSESPELPGCRARRMGRGLQTRFGSSVRVPFAIEHVPLNGRRKKGVEHSRRGLSVLHCCYLHIFADLRFDLYTV